MGFIINPYFFAAATPFTNTYSVDFDGVDEYVGTGSSITDLGITDKFTFSFWVKFDSFTDWDGIIGATSAGSFSNGFGCYAKADGKIYTFINNYASGGRVVSSTLSTATWYHVLWCYDGTLGSSNIEVFIDGSSIGTAAFTATVTTHALSVFNIGRLSPNSTPYYSFNGNLDEVAVWNTDQRADVATIYNSGTPTDLSSLSPVAWYRMGDGDTFNMLDNEQAYSNRSVDFDGVDEFVTMGDVLDEDGTGAFSISFWENLDSTGNTHLVGKMLNSDTYAGYSAYINSNKLRFAIINSFSGNTLMVDTTTSLSSGTWQHIVITYDGSQDVSGVTIYINGSNDELTTIYDSLDSSSTTTAPFTIASRNGTAMFTDGKIDEVSFFNSELTSGNVTTIYNSGVPNDISGLSPVGWWRMGEGDTYPTLTDSGSGSNDGTMTNMESGDITGAETTGIMTNMVSGNIVADVP